MGKCKGEARGEASISFFVEKQKIFREKAETLK
jgi:hypothetical protein